LKTPGPNRWVPVDRRARQGIAVCALVLVLAGTAVFAGTAAAAILATLSALGCGIALVRLLGRFDHARARIDQLTGRATDLEAAVARETRARENAEGQLAARIQLTSIRSATQNDSLTDEATGLYSEGYFTVALDARVAVARRNLRPVAVVLLDVIEDLHAERPHPADSTGVALSIAATIREADTACRLLDGGYALILEDTSENGAIWAVERIRRHLARTGTGYTVWAGIACYPAHGFNTDEVLDRADLALDAAREWRQDRIEVAHRAE
jgi:diguanylate cyclase (GGDEF)-like protein